MSNAITYNRLDDEQPAYDRWMGGNAWEEDGAAIEQEEMNTVDNMSSGEILNESLPYYKWEYALLIRFNEELIEDFTDVVNILKTITKSELIINFENEICSHSKYKMSLIMN